MTHAEIRAAVRLALDKMDKSDKVLQQSYTESIPSVAKLLKEDSAVLYRSAVLALKDAVSHLN